MLRNNWKRKGEDIDVLWKILKQYDNKIQITKTSSENLVFYHIIKECQRKYLNCFMFKPFNVWNNFKEESNIIKGFRERLLSEQKWFGKKQKEHFLLINDMLVNENDRLLISYDDSKPCFIIPKTIAKLGNLLGISGRNLVKSSLERDLMLSKSSEESVPITIVSLKSNKVEKIINILGEKYAFTPQLFLKEIYDYIKSKVDPLIFNNIKIDWEVDHLSTTIRLIFSNIDRGNKYPIIEIKNSVSGYSSFYIKGYWIQNDTETEFFNTSQKHTSELKKDKICEAIDILLKEIKLYKENVFSYTAVDNSFVFALNGDLKVKSNTENS